MSDSTGTEPDFVTATEAAHHPRRTDVDPKAARRAERQVARWSASSQRSSSCAVGAWSTMLGWPVGGRLSSSTAAACSTAVNPLCWGAGAGEGGCVANRRPRGVGASGRCSHGDSRLSRGSSRRRERTSACAQAALPSGSLITARQALEAGRDVFIEKPVGRDLAEARAVARKAQALGRAREVQGFGHGEAVADLIELHVSLLKQAFGR